jgi:AcrR family transcriptional regulator
MSELAELGVDPLPSPPTQKGLAMRERLLKAAARAFTLRGYELTRVEDIAKGARTSYGNFYRHFRNKDEVLMAVLRPLLDDVYVSSKRRAGPSAGLTEDEFVANTVTFLRIYARHRELLRVMREAAARGEKASFYSMWIEERERFVRRYRPGGRRGNARRAHRAARLRQARARPGEAERRRNRASRVAQRAYLVPRSFRTRTIEVAVNA